MKEQFATYKIALAVKELGFDESCFAYYEISDLIKKGYRLRYVEHEDNNPTKQSKNNSYILAPLWQQVIDWFREEHDLHISIDRNIYENVWKYNIVTIHQPGIYLIQSVAESRYNSVQFTKIREQAILTAIEIINQRING